MAPMNYKQMVTDGLNNEISFKGLHIITKMEFFLYNFGNLSTIITTQMGCFGSIFGLCTLIQRKITTKTALSIPEYR